MPDTWLDGSILAQGLDGTSGVISSQLPTTTYYRQAAIIGDVNGDGYDDRISSNYDYGGLFQGVGYVEFGTSGGGFVSAFTVDSNVAWTRLGMTVGGEDINNDGYVDVYFSSELGDGFWVYGRTSNQTEGDASDNTLTGANGDDTLNGYDGDDTLDGGLRHDTLNGGIGNDLLRGGAGDDSLSGGDGNDRLIGGAGADDMTGGLGDDSYVVDDAGDVVTELAGEGTDLVNCWLEGYTLADNVEKLILRGNIAVAHGNGENNTLTGNTAANTIDGGDGYDVIRGAGGNDTLSGDAGYDYLYGGRGNDTLDAGADGGSLNGGKGIDTLIGGAGIDRFVFHTADAKVDSSTLDFIEGFTQGQDLIDLAFFDANETVLGTQSFNFVGTDALAATGRTGDLRYWNDDDAGYTWVEGDTDGDGAADLVIRLVGHIDLAASDFSFIT